MSLERRVENLEAEASRRMPPAEDRDLSRLSTEELRRLRAILVKIERDGMDAVSDEELMEAERLYLQCPLTRKDGYQ